MRFIIALNLKRYLEKNKKANYCFFIFGFAINDAIYPKKTAEAIPPLEDLTPPMNAPSKP